MQHWFDVDIATEYGVLEAILMEHFNFWLTKNKANEKNFIDGRYWTHNSTKAFQALFPYVSQKQIQSALKHLKDEDLILVGKYNDSAYDHTLWYAFTEKAETIMQKGKNISMKNILTITPKSKIDYPEMSNRLSENVKSILININNKDVTNTDIDPDIDLFVENTEEMPSAEESIPDKPKKQKRFVKPTVDEVRAYCEERHNGIDAQTFINYYDANGWITGRTHMKDWKACVRYWEQNRKNKETRNKSYGRDTSNPYSSEEYNDLPF